MRNHDMVRDIFAITPESREYSHRLEQTLYVLSVLKLREQRLYETVQLFYKQNLTLYQIAELLELSPTTISRRLSRFRRLVKDRFPNAGELAPIYLTK